MPLRPAPATSVTAALPADVRAMSATATVLIPIAVLVLLGLVLTWALRLPVFAIGSVHIVGDVAHNSAATLRAHVRAGLAGNFFTLDLNATRRAFEEAPWVRRAVVNRQWPNQLAVRLEEHRAVALWGADDDLLVNNHGEVFAANLGDLDVQSLPVLEGPQGSAGTMLALLGRLAPVLAGMQARVTTLTLTGRGSWSMQLDSGASVELGRGNEAELVQRTEKFARSVGAVMARYERPLLYADLRHQQGYAVRLKGISTVNDTASTAGRN